MRYTQLVNFEIGDGCPFAKVHPFCPAGRMRLARSETSSIINRLDDELLVVTAASLYECHDFRGMIGFHYYCEPWAHVARMSSVMRGITELAGPRARFLLWTNLAMHVKPQEEHKLLSCFDHIHVSIYKDLPEREANAALRNITQVNGNVEVHYQTNDGRAEISGLRVPAPGPCYRPFLEMSFDVGGRVHACCYDWRREIDLGTLGEDSLDVIIERWRTFRASLCAAPHGYPVLSYAAPVTCKSCVHRHGELCTVDPVIARETAAALGGGEV